MAHSREILAQSMDTYRHALSDPSFGERYVDGHPVSWDHVFASVQSLAQENVAEWPPDKFEVVIVDEFHHAAATNEAYARLLSHLRPRELVGLTATPERPDGAPILDWFDGRIAAELRLWDAIDRGLLVPFQYFAVHDVASIESVGFLRGGSRLDPRQHGDLYTGHHARAHLAVEAIRQHVEDPQTMRALVFCATVEHARFMADVFEKAGLAAACVTGTTSKADRDQALAGLRNGTVRCICAVDVFNEGVDIPELDTVLFLRPTESAIVFQQQLARRLRRAPGKRCLTVLDFVSKADHRFRYDIRYRALLGSHAGRDSIKRQVEEGFPYLPSGCAITFDRVSRETVLDNVSHGIGADRRSLVRELRNVGPVDLRTLRETQLALEDIYRNGRSFSELKRAAGHPCPAAGPREDDFARGLGRLLHTDDRLRLTPWRDLVSRDISSAPVHPRGERLHPMLATTLLGPEATASSIAFLWQHPEILEELSQIFEILDDRLDHAVLPFRLAQDVPLSIHAHYRL